MSVVLCSNIFDVLNIQIIYLSLEKGQDFPIRQITRTPIFDSLYYKEEELFQCKEKLKCFNLESVFSASLEILQGTRYKCQMDKNINFTPEFCR